MFIQTFFILFIFYSLSFTFGFPSTNSSKFELLKTNFNKISNLYFIRELYYFSKERFKEIKKSIILTLKSNVNARMIFLINEKYLVNILEHQFSNISYDLYYVGEINYGTIIELGNYYPGVKIASSADNFYPTINFKCSFLSVNKSIVYALSRKDIGYKTKSCLFYMNQGSFDGLMYNFIPTHTIESMKYSRDYNGCENLAAYALKRDGIEIINLCPKYYALHYHNSNKRSNSRLRINHYDNSYSPNNNFEKYCNF